MLKRDKARLQEAAEDAAAAAATLAEVAAAVDQCAAPRVPLHDVAAAYTELQRRYPEEYVMYNLPAAALAQARLYSLVESTGDNLHRPEQAAGAATAAGPFSF